MNASKLSFADKAALAHGEALPDWVAELAACADREKLVGAGRRIGYSGPTVSQVITGTYGGDLDHVEQRVRGALMGAVVECPMLGELARNLCLDWQRKPFAATSAHRVAMFRACKTCTHNRSEQS